MCWSAVCAWGAAGLQKGFQSLQSCFLVKRQGRLLLPPVAAGGGGSGGSCCAGAGPPSQPHGPHPHPPTLHSPLTHCSCPSGYETRVNGTGASSCSMCRPGFFAPNPNTPFCQPCTPGTFAPVAGSKACKLCSAGEVTGPLPGDARIGGAGMNATFCTPCGRRTFRPSIYAANTCVRCPAGRETRRAQGATTCTACIPGSTLLSADDFSCTSCGAGASAGAGWGGAGW